MEKESRKVSEILTNLNPEQCRAVENYDHTALIIAGAGSGKTRVLTHRIAYMIEQGVPVRAILALTFTNKAARELKERLEKAVGEGSNEIWAATFHSTCARILRRFADKIGFSDRFTIYDTNDQRKLMKEILKQLNIDEKMLPHRSVLTEISRAKDSLISPEEYANGASADVRKTLIARAYQEYQKALVTNDAMDFYELMYNTIVLFEENEDVI